MIKVSVIFCKFNSKEEWITFAQKICAEKRFKKYMYFENEPDFKKYNSVEDYINDFWDNCTFIDVIIGQLFSITTKSHKTLKLLNEFIKENHYENNYRIWWESGECKLKMTLDELLEKYLK